MDGKDSKDDFLTKQLQLADKDDSSINPPQPLNQAVLENKDEDSDPSPAADTKFYFFDKSADISKLAELHQKSGGKAEYTKWRSWNFAQEMENKQKDKLIEQMAARLQEIEEKLQIIQKPGAD